MARRVALRPPSWVIESFGLKPSVAQLTTRKGEVKATAVPWSPIPSEPTEKGLQLVGLIMKLGLLMLTWISRMRIGMPPIIEGTGSESAMTCASEGSICKATRTTTVP